MMMWQLYLGLLLFCGTHLYSTVFPSSRDRLKSSFGEGAFKGLYSLLSALGLVLLAWAYVAGRGDGTLLYEPLYAARHVILLLILFAFILIFSNGSQSHIRGAVKHPFSIGIALWSIAHLMMNGEPAVVGIFGGFLVVALADLVFSFARGKVPRFEPRWSHDLRGIAVGVILYLVFAFGFHTYVLNVPVAG
jgi:uncharacterized membrane protein